MAILHRSSLQERERRKIKKGELPLSPHPLRADGKGTAGLRIYRRVESNTICCPGDEDAHGSSNLMPSLPTLQLLG